jgi:hypothetical protein
MASSIVEEIEVDLVTGMASRIAASVDEIGGKGLASKRIARRQVLRSFVRTMLLAKYTSKPLMPSEYDWHLCLLPETLVLSPREVERLGHFPP